MSSVFHEVDGTYDLKKSELTRMELNQVRANVSRQWIIQRQSNDLIPSSNIWVLRRIHFLLEFFNYETERLFGESKTLKRQEPRLHQRNPLKAHLLYSTQSSPGRPREQMANVVQDPNTGIPRTLKCGSLIQHQSAKIEQLCYQQGWRCTSIWSHQQKRCSSSQLEKSPTGVSYHLWAPHH